MLDVTRSDYGSMSSMADAEVSASEKTYEAMRSAIIAGEYAPGDALSRPQLAKTFGVSQTPLREALLRLEREGFITVYPQAKTLVAPIDLVSLHQAHLLRNAVECDVVRRIAKKPEIRDLTEVIDLAETNNATPDDFVALDHAFHRSLFLALGMGQVFDGIQGLLAPLDRCQVFRFSTQDAVDTAVKFHRDILKRILASDPGGSVQAMRAHLMGEMKGLSEWQKSHPEMF